MTKIKNKKALIILLIVSILIALLFFTIYIVNIPVVSVPKNGNCGINPYAPPCSIPK